MSILIKGMEMPDVRQAYAGLIIRWDGKVYPFSIPQGYKLGESVATAVPVSPHGDLIDRDRAVRDLRMDYAYTAARIIELQPTIIPAEEATQREERRDEASASPYDILYEEGGVNT